MFFTANNILVEMMTTSHSFKMENYLQVWYKYEETESATSGIKCPSDFSSALFGFFPFPFQKLQGCLLQVFSMLCPSQQ